MQTMRNVDVLKYPACKYAADFHESSHSSLDDDSVISIDLVNDVGDKEGYRKLTKSLFVEKILDVSFSKVSL